MLNNIVPEGRIIEGPIILFIVKAVYVALWWVVPMKMAKARSRNKWGWVVGAHLLTAPATIFLLTVMGKAQDSSE